jgi:hypothetical protein
MLYQNLLDRIVVAQASNYYIGDCRGFLNGVGDPNTVGGSSA